jgi:anti-sigma factor RsiW
MNSQEVMRILDGYRPGFGAEADPQVAEALRQVERDPALAQWLASQQRFDVEMSAAVKGISVPPDLKQQILKSRNIIKVPFWSRPLPSAWRAPIAAAAAVLVLATISGAIIAQPASPFSDFRLDLVTQDWGGTPHLDFESNDLNKLKQWLAEHQGVSDFTLPAGLSSLSIRGCRAFRRDGEKVSQICLADGPRHLHLFIVNRADFPDLLPEGAPDFEKCGVWKTASWRQGDKTYVLTGLNSHTFVNKFRKGGKWTTSG